MPLTARPPFQSRASDIVGAPFPPAGRAGGWVGGVHTICVKNQRRAPARVALSRIGLRPVANRLRHLQPVELPFDLVKRVVADLLVVAHVENRLPGRLKGSVVDVGARRSAGRAGAGGAAVARQAGLELAPDQLGG